MKNLVLIVIFLVTVMALQTEAFTDPSDVEALEQLYQSLNNPPQLTSWTLDGGDPCGEPWDGVSCFDSSIISIELHGLDLSGSITAALYNLYNLKHLDISSNSIGGELPYMLPRHMTHINMASNKFTGNIPQTIADMKYLVYLKLSNNLLSGPVGNVFTGLKNIKQLDLSYNNFTGDVAVSFGSLANLTGLYLQENQFTVTVAHETMDMKFQQNYGVISNVFQSLPNILIGRNSCEVSGNNCPSWDIPLETKARDLEQNTQLPPATHSSVKNSAHLNKKHGYPIIIGIVGCCIVAAAAVVACMAARRDPNNEQPVEQPAGVLLRPPRPAARRDPNNEQPVEQPAGILFRLPRPPEKLVLGRRFVAGTHFQLEADGKSHEADTEEKVVRKASKKPDVPFPVKPDTFIDHVEPDE